MAQREQEHIDEMAALKKKLYEGYAQSNDLSLIYSQLAMLTSAVNGLTAQLTVQSQWNPGAAVFTPFLHLKSHQQKMKRYSFRQRELPQSDFTETSSKRPTEVDPVKTVQKKTSAPWQK